MITDNNKTTIKLLIGILIILILLCICITIDSASDTDTITNTNEFALEDMPKNVVVVNESYAPSKNSGQAVSDGKIYTDKKVKDNKTVKHKNKAKKNKQTITMTGRPSCSRCARNHCSYTWRTKTYLNYCPNCKHYNCLGNKHKSGSVHEQEITCFHCDSDFCINCGKEKYAWSRVYLAKA